MSRSSAPEQQPNLHALTTVIDARSQPGNMEVEALSELLDRPLGSGTMHVVIFFFKMNQRILQVQHQHGRGRLAQRVHGRSVGFVFCSLPVPPLTLGVRHRGVRLAAFDRVKVLGVQSDRLVRIHLRLSVCHALLG